METRVGMAAVWTRRGSTLGLVRRPGDWRRRRGSGRWWVVGGLKGLRGMAVDMMMLGGDWASIYTRRHARPVHSGRTGCGRRWVGSCAGRRWEGDEKRSGRQKRKNKGRAPNLSTSTRICTKSHQSHNNFTECAPPKLGHISAPRAVSKLGLRALAAHRAEGAMSDFHRPSTSAIDDDHRGQCASMPQSKGWHWRGQTALVLDIRPIDFRCILGRRAIMASGAGLT